MNCMGGWCLKRQNCVYYWQESHMTMERLCEPDNTDAYQRVTVDFPASVSRPVAHPVSIKRQAGIARMAGAIQEAASDILARA
jgi:hypothetical protein